MIRANVFIDRRSYTFIVKEEENLSINLQDGSGPSKRETPTSISLRGLVGRTTKSQAYRRLDRSRLTVDGCFTVRRTGAAGSGPTGPPGLFPLCPSSGAHRFPAGRKRFPFPNRAGHAPDATQRRAGAHPDHSSRAINTIRLATTAAGSRARAWLALSQSQ